MYFYVDDNKSQKLQKQAISKRIVELKGATRLRNILEQTDFIVVDSDFFKMNSVPINNHTGASAPTSASEQYIAGHYPPGPNGYSNCLNSPYVCKQLSEFLTKESLRILKCAKEIEKK